MSIDEEEFLKLLAEPRGEDSLSSPLHKNPETTADSQEDDEDVDVSGDLEKDLEAAMLSAEESNEEEDSGEKGDEMPHLSPVTPQEVIDMRTHYKTDTASSNRAGKESPTEDSSVEPEMAINTDGLKRKAMTTEPKSPSKKTRYYETDKSERKQGWAERMLLKSRTVNIPKNPQVTCIQNKEKHPVPVSLGMYTNGQGQNRSGKNGMHDTSFMPPGWLDCPGLEGKWGLFLFSKTPLGERWNHRIPLQKRLTPQLVIRRAVERNQRIGLVIDLTNSLQYYDPYEFQRHGVQYHKIRCRGHGTTPSAEAVNEFWWVASSFVRQKTEKFILGDRQQCIEGFMVAHYTMRWAERDTMNGIIRTFATRRPPGIYKNEYIDDLLDYYHENRSARLLTPSVPEWKEIQEEEKEDEKQESGTIENARVRMTTDKPITSDDVFGERVHPQEEEHLQFLVLEAMLGPHRTFRRFPGAQPVSMDRRNIELLQTSRYWVTYKADGTRYMLLLTKFGVFAINRDFEFQRVELRFPIEFRSDQQIPNPGIPHHMTLLDGEMVIDHHKDTNTYTRRYLIYDLVIHNGESWINLPWKQRFGRVEEIVNMRNSERRQIERKQWLFEYDYSMEPFQIEAKMFRCLGQIDSIIRAIPRLEHECDGLIFQAYEDKYRVGTHDELLKWKYAHMNSVDFLYRHRPDDTSMHLFYLARDDRCVSGTVDGQLYLMRRNEILCDGVTVVFDKDSDKEKYNGKIIECVYDKEQDRWKFLRERVDKRQPNAYIVYEKVLQSIRDNITQPELLNTTRELFSETDVYGKDREKLAACDQRNL